MRSGNKEGKWERPLRGCLLFIFNMELFKAGGVPPSAERLGQLHRAAGHVSHRAHYEWKPLCSLMPLAPGKMVESDRRNGPAFLCPHA